MERASPSGFLGRRRERKAQERGFSAVMSAYAGVDLIDAIVEAAEAGGRLLDELRKDDRSFADDAIANAAIASKAIESKGSREELEAYRIGVIGICEDVAVADQEAGPGVLSPAEATLLRRLAGALGRPDYEPGNPDFTPPGRQTRVFLVGLDDSGVERGLGQQRR
jgi:hypothetical protein